MPKKESGNTVPGKNEASKMSPLFEEAARILSNLAIENILLTRDILLKRLNEDFKGLKPEETESLIKLFSKKEEDHG